MKIDNREVIAKYGDINLFHEPPEIVSTFNFFISFDMANIDLKQKRDLKEELKFIDINNTYLEFYTQPNNSKEYLGNTLIEFLNNIQKVRELFEVCKNNISNSITEETNKYVAVDLLKLLCENFKTSSDLKHCSRLIQNEIYTFIKNGIPTRERFLSTTEEFKGKIDNPRFYQTQCIAFINRFLRNLDKLENLAQNSFEKKKVNSDESDYNLANKFNIDDLVIPTADLQFNKNKSTIIQYTYKVHTIEDLMNITIYHLMLNNNVLVKCKCCHKYFIPIRNNRSYCTTTIWGTRKNGENITCEHKVKQGYHTSRESTYIKKYNNIYKKINKHLNTEKINLRKNIKIKKELDKLFADFKNEYKKTCKKYKYDKNNIEFKKELDKLFNTINKDYEKLKIN